MAKVYGATKHSGYHLLRTVISSEEALTDTQKTAARLASEIVYPIPELMNNMEVRISSNDSSASGTAYFYTAKDNDDIVLLGSSAITAGNQLASSNKFYIDTMTLTDRWITEVKKVDADGNDGMSRIVFDTSGYDNFFIHINYGTPSWNWDVEISGFN